MKRRFTAVVIVIVFACALVGCTEEKIDYGNKTKYLDNVFYSMGAYPRSEVDGETANLLEEAYDNGSLETDGAYYAYDGEKYARVVVRNNYGDSLENTDEDFFRFTRYKVGSVHWFLVEPIVWRVLNTQNGLAVLTTKELIYAMPFSDSEEKSYLWENSAVRRFLNEEFFEQAFSQEEKAEIRECPTECCYISNPGRLKYDRTEVYDKVRLLSWKEARLPGQFKDDLARTAKVTDYAAANGGARLTADTIVEYYQKDPADYADYLDCGIYWLSDTELNTNHVYFVYELGYTSSNLPNEGNRTVRPVVVIKNRTGLR